MKNIYLVKNLTPWMMDELIALADELSFDLVLLRKPNAFYLSGLEVLKHKGVNIKIEPQKFNFLIKKLNTISKFTFRNFGRLGVDYNFIIWLKSIHWFFQLDLNAFGKNSHIHSQFATQAALVSVLVKEYFDQEPKISFTFHAYDIYFNNKWFTLLLEKCENAFSISDYNIKYISDHYKPSDKLVLSRLGVFKDKINSDKTIKKGVFTIGFMSWFVEKKGIFYLLEAMKNLISEEKIKIQLMLAGDGPLREKILKFIDENDLAEHIKYLGKLDSEKKDKFYNSLDCFALPSIKLKNDQDGIPVVLMEAIAYGIPVISTNVSGIPEICINNYNGILVDERNVDQLQMAILNLYQNFDKNLDFSKHSKKLSENYDIRVNSRKKIEHLKWK